MSLKTKNFDRSDRLLLTRCSLHILTIKTRNLQINRNFQIISNILKHVA